jgi:dTDP-4-dehydrorhamnose 3,5-epimerase
VRFVETDLAGAFVVEPELLRDERGFFARLFSPAEFAARGLRSDVDQVAVSWNARRGTLRGLHYQAAPQAQAKLVRCTRGAVHDVIVDLRGGSPTRARWLAVELSADNRRLLYVPEGFAHGFLTLTDDAEVVYQMSGAWHAPAERGARFDDPAFAIAWPFAPQVISARDRAFPDWDASALD